MPPSNFLNQPKLPAADVFTSMHKILTAISLGLILLGIISNETDFNLFFTSLFTNDQNEFPFRNHWLTKVVLHDYAAKLTILLFLSLLVFNVKQWFSPSSSPRLIIAGRYLMWSWVASTLTIGYLKTITTLPCPWNVVQFGGNSVYLSIINIFSDIYPVGHCFPSAHATGGYGLLGLGFIALIYGKSFISGIAPALLVGFIYGGAQMVRGAHFVSHDFFSIAICLLYANLFAMLYLLPQLEKNYFQTNV